MDNERMFLIAIDIHNPPVDLMHVKLLFETSDVIRNWWNHIPGCFLVTSTLGSEALADLMRTVTGKTRLLVMEVKPQESAGWLPARSWDWIIERETADAASSLVK